MELFIGTHYGKLDEKGRVSFPVNFRQAATDGAEQQFCMVANVDVYDQCLVLMTKADFDQQMTLTKQKLNLYDEEDQRVLRELYRDTERLDGDNAGRIMLSKSLCELVNINKDVVFVGWGNEIKLWAKEQYETTRVDKQTKAALVQKRLGNAHN
ncbi:transcriptional regulator MraZ [Bacteroidia bacterium]|nr:transcriptional regulator MraZ [Bacteroidia bacterium]